MILLARAPRIKIEEANCININKKREKITYVKDQTRSFW